MSAIRAHVSESGRISIPVAIRKAVGLDRGGEVVVEAVGREIRIRTIDGVIAASQAIARRLTAGKAKVSVDAFLADRRREADQE